MGPASSRSSKWPAIIATALTFGIYHFVIDRVPVTALMGICLGYLCWQSRSIWPAMLFHALHNGLLTGINAVSPETVQRLGVPNSVTGLLPARLFIPAAVLFLAGLALAASIRPTAHEPSIQSSLESDLTA